MALDHANVAIFESLAGSGLEWVDFRATWCGT